MKKILLDSLEMVAPFLAGAISALTVFGLFSLLLKFLLNCTGG